MSFSGLDPSQPHLWVVLSQSLGGARIQLSGSADHVSCTIGSPYQLHHSSLSSSPIMDQLPLQNATSQDLPWNHSIAVKWVLTWLCSVACRSGHHGRRRSMMRQSFACCSECASVRWSLELLKLSHLVQPVGRLGYPSIVLDAVSYPSASGKAVPIMTVQNLCIVRYHRIFTDNL